MIYIANLQADDSFEGVPIGGIIDFWCPSNIGIPILAVPIGYQICDHSQIIDSESPFYLEYTPNLIDKFIRGYDFTGLNDSNTNESFDFSHTHNIDHSHGIAAHNHTASTGYSNQAFGPGNHGGIGGERTAYNHVHGYNAGGSGSAGASTGSSDTPNSNSAGSSNEKKPEYIQLLKLMRIK